MEAILKAREKSDVEEMMEYLKTLTPEEKAAMKSFIQGVIFAKQTSERKTA